MQSSLYLNILLWSTRGASYQLEKLWGKELEKWLAIKKFKEMGRPTKIIIDTEAYIMTAAEMEGLYVMPRDTISIRNDL